MGRTSKDYIDLCKGMKMKVFSASRHAKMGFQNAAIPYCKVLKRYLQNILAAIFMHKHVNVNSNKRKLKPLNVCVQIKPILETRSESARVCDYPELMLTENSF